MRNQPCIIYARVSSKEQKQKGKGDGPRKCVMRWTAVVLVGLSFMTMTFPSTEAEQTNASENVFEVKCVSTSTTFYQLGKVKKDKGGDQVVYRVDLPAKTVTRIAVFNKNFPEESIFSGLHSDDTVYSIVHNAIDFDTKQRIIKAVGRTGLDGYETIVIGDDFCTTSRSTSNYFVLDSYKRNK